MSVDPTVVRVHEHATGSPPRGPPADEPVDHADDRSRSGLTTKIHLAADGNCRPLASIVTAGQAGGAPAFTGVIARLLSPSCRASADSAGQGSGRQGVLLPGHPRTPGTTRATIPVPADQQGWHYDRGSHGGRPSSTVRHTSSATPSSDVAPGNWRAIATRRQASASGGDGRFGGAVTREPSRA